jgi:transcriptional regulator with XRE-family HTH domain
MTIHAENLLSVLNRSIRSSGLSRREIERRLGVGQGYLNSIFKGRIQLRVSHVEEIARVLNVEPLSLFLQAFPPKDPDWLLEQLGIVPGGKPPAGLALVPDLGEINRFVREVVRDEMTRISEEP